MESQSRILNRGRLVEKQSLLKRLKIEIDVIVKGLIIHFEPLDNDCEYVHNIDPIRLETYVNEIKRKKRELDKVRAEVNRLKEEIGEDG